MTVADISVETDDFDTVGGRLSRARDAKELSLEQVAELVGVEEQTLHGWECDQAEPRSNKLTMLAVVLGVSPSWLLFGRGSSPVQETTQASLEAIEMQLEQLKSHYQSMGTIIENMEASLRRVETDSAAQG